jgi:predicted transcriptional regulator
MPKATTRTSTVLTIRVTPEISRRLARAARRSRRTRSETARALLATALAGDALEDPAAEARRQSLLASERASERDMLTFITTAADLRGWR